MLAHQFVEIRHPGAVTQAVAPGMTGGVPGILGAVNVIAQGVGKRGTRPTLQGTHQLTEELRGPGVLPVQQLHRDGIGDRIPIGHQEQVQLRAQPGKHRQYRGGIRQRAGVHHRRLQQAILACRKQHVFARFQRAEVKTAVQSPLFQCRATGQLIHPASREHRVATDDRNVHLRFSHRGFLCWSLSSRGSGMPVGQADASRLLSSAPPRP